MSLSMQLVRRLHRLHEQLADVRGQLRRGPLQLKVAEQKVESIEQQIAEQQAELRKRRMLADQKQLQLASREAKLVDWEGKLNSATKDREFQAIKEQIAADRQANLVLSDEILEVMESLDDSHRLIASLQEQLQIVTKERDAFAEQLAARAVVLQAEQQRLEEDLAGTERQIPGDFAPDYRRMVAGRGEDAMAPLDGESCGGCYQIISPSLLDKLRLGQPVICTSCSRLLYSGDSQTVGR